MGCALKWLTKFDEHTRYVVFPFIRPVTPESLWSFTVNSIVVPYFHILQAYRLIAGVIQLVPWENGVNSIGPVSIVHLEPHGMDRVLLGGYMNIVNRYVGLLVCLSYCKLSVSYRNPFRFLQKIPRF